MNPRALAISCFLAACSVQAHSRGVSPYLPLNLDPEIERQIERVLILADSAELTRPFAAATVLDALPRACKIDSELCAQVRHYLHRYMELAEVTHLSIEGVAAGGAEKTLPNRQGLGSDSAWQASTSLYWQPANLLAINLGAVAYQGEVIPSGSFVSLGVSRAQLDVGYRPHWLSPFTDSSMLLGTQAATMPSATLSNYAPLTRLGFRYEMFLGRLSSSDRIAFEDGFTSGEPKLLGMHMSISPAAGWSLGVNRLMQFGGGERDGSSASDILEAFFRPSSADNTSGNDEFGNQLASITSRFVFPGRTPFAVYFEYGGEDTSRSRNYLLGNASLSAGIQFPRLWQRFDLAYEASEWQNGWYVNSIYGDGLTNEGHVLGHWGGDERATGDGVGGQSHMLRLGWDPTFGGTLEMRLRTLANESYSSVEYHRAHDVTLRYAYPLGAFSLGAEVFAGQDVFGENFSRVGLFVRHSDYGFRPSSKEPTLTSGDTEGAELFVEAGIGANEVTADVTAEEPRTTSEAAITPHVAFGARRAVSNRSDLGVRVELDEIEGELFMGVRALDYRYRFSGPLALGVFLGAARYDLATPAYGIYGGVGAQWRDLMPGWDVGLDLRYASKVARDRLDESDPESERPDLFYDISGITLVLSRRF